MEMQSKRWSKVLLQPIQNEKWQSLTIPLVSILFSLIAAAIVIILLGKKSVTSLFQFIARRRANAEARLCRI